MFSVLLLLFAVPAMAGPQGPDQRGGSQQQPPPPFKWWQADKTRIELGLTNDQSARIEEIFQSAAPRLRSAFEDVDKYEKQLSRLISANDATEVDVIRQLNQVQAARNEADRQRTLMLFRMQRVLTADQRTKLTAIRERWEQERRNGRRGDPPPGRGQQVRK